DGGVRMRHVLLSSAALALVWSGVAAAQDAQRIGASPSLGARHVTVRMVPEESSAPVLRQLISLHLRDAPLEEALTAITRQVSGRLMFEDVADSIDRRVTLTEKEISVREALDRVLQGTNLEVVVPNGGSLVLIKERAVPEAPAPQDTAKIRGRVV